MPPASTAITLDTPTECVLNSGNVFYTFTPSVDGIYYFYSTTNNCDPYGYVYDETGNLLASNDDGNGNLNFYMEVSLTAGKTYYFKVRNLDNDDSTPKTTITLSMTSPYAD